MYLIKEKINLLEVQLYQSAEKNRLKLMDSIMHKDISQVESLMMCIDMEKLWYVITDWRELIKYVHIIGKSVDYYDEPRIIGTRFDLDDGNSVSTFWVKKAEISERQGEFGVEAGNGVDSPRQEILFSLDYVDREMTFLSFRHVFRDPVRLNKLASLSAEKKKILQSLKDALMK